MGDQAAKVIADQTHRLHRELEGLWAAADLVVLVRALAASRGNSADQAQLIRRIDEFDDRIGDALVQVEDTAAALSDAVSAIRWLVPVGQLAGTSVTPLDVAAPRSK